MKDLLNSRIWRILDKQDKLNYNICYDCPSEGYDRAREEERKKEEWEENLSFCERAIQHLLGSGRNLFLVELIELWEECYKALGKPKFVLSFLQENHNLYEIYFLEKGSGSYFILAPIVQRGEAD